MPSSALCEDEDVNSEMTGEFDLPVLTNQETPMVQPQSLAATLFMVQLLIFLTSHHAQASSQPCCQHVSVCEHEFRANGGK